MNHNLHPRDDNPLPVAIERRNRGIRWVLWRSSARKIYAPYYRGKSFRFGFSQKPNTPAVFQLSSGKNFHRKQISCYINLPRDERNNASLRHCREVFLHFLSPSSWHLFSIARLRQLMMTSLSSRICGNYLFKLSKASIYYLLYFIFFLSSSSFWFLVSSFYLYLAFDF